MTAAAPASERLLCDTSFVGHSARREAQPERYSHWPEAVVARIDRAILAISVITLAEVRFGFLKANWAAARIEREERRLAGFLQVPLDLQVVDEWARIRDLSMRSGWNISDNDLWIAATASSRGFPLITCDGDQARLNDLGLAVIHLASPS